MAKNQLERLQRQRVNVDRRVTIAITMGGWLVLVTLLMLVWHLFSVTQPILDKPHLAFQGEFNHSQHFPPQIGSRTQSTFQYFYQDDVCTVAVAEVEITSNLAPKSSSASPRSQQSCDDKQKLLFTPRSPLLVKMSQNGLLRIYQFDQVTERFRHQIFSARVSRDNSYGELNSWQIHVTDERVLLLVNYGGSDSYFYEFELQSRLLLRETVINEQPEQLRLVQNNKLNMLFDARQLFLLPDSANAIWQTFRDDGDSTILDVVSLSSQRSVLLLDSEFTLEKWSILNAGGRKVLNKIYTLELSNFTPAPAVGPLLSSEGAVRRSFHGLVHINKDLAVVSIADKVIFINATTGQVVNVDQLEGDEVNGESEQLLHFGENVLARTGDNYRVFSIQNPSSTITSQSLWGEIWYDGYPEPNYVWQTSSASDELQAKYSVVPLLMGSIKAAGLALIVAIPLAIGSAIYSAYYAGPKIRRIIKPYIEILEAIPSVVIGFIAVIWLLPVSENYLLATLLFFLLTPIFLLLFVWLNESKRHLNVAGWELLFFAGVIICYLGLFQIILAEEQQLLSWILLSETGNHLSTELKNTFVLALALGIAIVPTVFTIAEDAIHQVPKSLPLASFALGASRSQTLLRIIIKVAMPGIVSAIMLGFARAVGETMIVLMVSGNTPLAEWDILEGIRTMTANLAIELPEAPPDSVHYQILFLVALLLFGFTFVFNTLAELLRIRLRSRYKL